MKKTILAVVVIILYSQPEPVVCEPRAQVVDFRCGTVIEHNTTAFAANFIATMGVISDQMRTTGFGLTQRGTGPDTNYGLAQCYGDLSLADCVLCFSMIHIRLPECFPYNSGRIYLDGCFMRLENYTFYDEIATSHDNTLCGNTTSKNSGFQESARRALVDAVAEASGDNGGFARSRVAVVGARNESAFVLANCWRNLNSSSCRLCLDNATASIMGCLPWSEGRVTKAGCFLRYSDTDFLNEEQGGGGSKVSKTVIVAIVVASVVATLIGGILGRYIQQRRKLQQKRRGTADKLMAKSLRKSSLNFKFITLEKATGYFNDANKLGQGGFGVVYKGVLADGREVAVKRLFVNNRHRAADFYNEVTLISSVDHKNLVRLLGCSCFGPESLLVYEFLPNMSLDRFLFDADKSKLLIWQKRFDIIVGTTEGLVYLHENENVRIIHRDIKASNILLDSKLRAKIADFGLARTFEEDKSHISTVVAGTLGYMAPEYLAYGQLTDKADVYSFGVLLLEIVTGRPNNKKGNDDISDSLIVTAWKHFQNGTAEELFDPNLMLHNECNNDNVKNEMLRVLHLGLLCTQEVPSLRPFMSMVRQMLSNTDELIAPTNPPFVDERTMELNDTCEDPLNQLNASCSPSVATLSTSSFCPR